MALAKELIGGGFSAGQAKASGGGYAPVTAVGSAQADAALIGAGMNMVTGADGSTGVRLLAGEVGDEVWVFNNAGSTLKVYPPTGAAITVGGTGLGSTNAAFSQLTYKASLYKCLTSTQWVVITSV